jgi:FlaA1/EpsC-like NDP-sugar epimerase
MLAQFYNYRFYIVLALDIIIFILAFVAAYLLRFDFILEPFYQAQILRVLPIILFCKIVIFFLFGLYRGMWRYIGVHDLWSLAQATLISMLCNISCISFTYGLKGFPRSIFLLDGIMTVLMSGGLRLGIRLYYAAFPGFYYLKLPWRLWDKNCAAAIKSFIIVGAGAAGEKMYREILDNPRLNYKILGFLDDDRAKWGRSLHGVKICGGVAMLPELTKIKKIDEVLIAIPSATGPQIRKIVEVCKSCQVRHRILPEIGAIIDGKVSIKSLRDVKYEDLLRRPPVPLDTTGINWYLKDKRVLVTGAGGSIGSELCRQIIRFEPTELILVDASEAQLFNIQMELQHDLKFPHYCCILCRVQDRRLMAKVFRQYRPQILFHAAAYKHVPMLENNPWKAISNNVLGSQVVTDLSLQYGVERFVLVSTDKAVRPTNVMGASKRLAELILQSRQGNGVLFMAVRFGNVIGSSGSVLPLFRRQLEHGGPITVTHPEMTRYFMTITEAAQLIVQAGGLGEGGEIFILEMGTPVKIAQMAEELVRLSGKEPGKDVEIIFTGVREGEKLCEELITKGEGIVDTGHEKIMVLRPKGWNGKNNLAEFTKWLDAALEDLYRIVNTHDSHAIRAKLKEILPEYVPQQNLMSVLKPKVVRLKATSEQH